MNSKVSNGGKAFFRGKAAARKAAKTPEERGQEAGYRSGLEVAVAKSLQDRNVNAEYESQKIRYTVPARPTYYTPDFILPNGIIIETKGIFSSADRTKHKHIKAQHPELEIRFVFSNSRTKIGKKSTTTYAKWCEQFGFKYADKDIPDSWLTEGNFPRVI